MDNHLLYHKLDFLHEMFERRNKRCHEKNISRGQGRILTILQRKDGFSTKDLSKILDIRVTSLNETLNKLEKNGYVNKVKSENDKRIYVIKLTDKGREFKPSAPRDIDVFDCLNESEKEIFDEYINRITHNFHFKLKDENPEKFEKMVRNRQEIFEKYFDCDSEEWFRLIDK